MVDYAEFFADLDRKLGQERYHIGHYFALPERDERLRMFCLLLDDRTSEVLLTSYCVEYYDETPLPR